MKSKLLVLLVSLVFATMSYGQSHFIDSIIAFRNPDSSTAFPKTYYTPSYQKKAAQFQTLFARASDFYGRRYHTDFSLHLAVLDASQWVTEKYPFGFLAYDSGWVFLPAVVGAPSFLNIYGFSQNNSNLNAFLKNKHLSLQQLSDAVYFVYSLHELGHYFTDEKEQVVIPDMFANEFIATYFSYCFFKATNNPALQTLIDFSGFVKSNYKPMYRNIGAMDSLYTSMPMANFKWFHCNIVLLCQEIYKVHGLHFIDYYLQAFKKGAAGALATQDVIDLLDKECKGKVKAWADGLIADKPR